MRSAIEGSDLIASRISRRLRCSRGIDLLSSFDQPQLCGRAAKMTFRANWFPRLKVTLPTRRLMPLPARSADPNDVGLAGPARRLDHLVTDTAIGANARLRKVRVVPKMVKLVSRAHAPVKFHGRTRFSMA